MGRLAATGSGSYPRGVKRAEIALAAALAAAACTRGKAGAAPPPSPPAAEKPSVELPAPHLITRGGEAMGTLVEIKIWGRDDAGAQAAISAAFEEIARLERLMTTWREDSDVSRVNANAGISPVAVAPETFEVIRRSLEFSRRSGGAFDITFYALKGLWKFDQDLDARLPDRKELRRRLPLIDYRKVKLDEAKRTVFLEKKGMAINLGGIAKGYAVDAAAAVLRRAGFPDSIVQAGGDLMLSGSKSGRPWQAGIRDPRAERDTYFAVAPVKDHAFSTAGDYERFFFIGGKRYHHIIDPKTGYPATAARSVTIYAPDATTADGLDDAVLILGPAKGLALVESFPDTGAVIVDADNRVHISKRLQGTVQVLQPPTPGP
jgi:thiamine biosynthesis lipoprotein